MFVFVIVAALTGGCTRTYISTGDPGVPSPDGVTRLILTAHGDYGRSYLEKSKKLLDVSVVRGPITNKHTLFEHRYKYVGADLWGRVQWDSTNKVVVNVYDYADGVFGGEAEKRGMPSNHIATLTLELDKTGKFVEKK